MTRLPIDRSALEIIPGRVDGVLLAPPSKSATNRALIMAALAEGESIVRAPLIADDTLHMVDALRALGAAILLRDNAWLVHGTGGVLRAPSEPLDCGLSGTTMRFLAAVATLAPGPVRLTGDAPLLRRPVGPLIDALRTLGVDASSTEGFPPIDIAGAGLDGGEVTIDATKSSQFVTAIMLVAPYAKNDIIIRARGAAAGGYWAMTAEMMRAFGARVTSLDVGVWRVDAGAGYGAREFDVEYDASAAAHLFALAVASGGRVTVFNAQDTLQPDAAITDVFEAMGARITGATVEGADRVSPVDVSVEEMPDQLATIATLCALAEGRSTITGAGVTRGHETDRIAAVATGLRALGASVDELPDGLVIDGPARHGARIATYDDHRMAMAFAALGARIPGVVIEEPGCVSKTYPDFWDDIARIGIGSKPA